MSTRSDFRRRTEHSSICSHDNNNNNNNNSSSSSCVTIRRKRSRSASSLSSSTTMSAATGQASLTSATAILLLIAAGNVILSPPSICQAFSSAIDTVGSSPSMTPSLFRRQQLSMAVSVASKHRDSIVSLYVASSSSSSPSSRMELAEQKVTVSAEKREAAIRAMQRDAMASALDGVDAQMLEMLSEEFLFPSYSSSSSSYSSSTSSSVYSSPSGYNGNDNSQPANMMRGETEYEELEPDYGPPPSSTRPAGRPNMVPGAMRKDTLAKYKKRRNLVKYIKKTTESAAATVASRSAASFSSAAGVGEGGGGAARSTSSSSSSYSSTKSMLDDLETRIHVKSREIARKKRSFAQQQRGAAAAANRSTVEAAASDVKSIDDLPSSSGDDDGNDTSDFIESSGGDKKSSSKRRRVVKNLPKRKEITMNDIGSLDESYKTLMSSDLKSNSKKSQKPRGAGAVNQLELKKYYQTELLTPEQEFELGHKIQIVVMCERVHEGLALRDMQLPTIREWAHACGYTDPDPDFDEDALINAEVRPVGADKMFEKTDPNMFVGNGLAHTMGVGRGRGRAKKPPPTALKDVYEINTKTGQKLKGTTTPINRGTVSEFVDMILDGRKAKQLMVQSNMRLVVSICRKYANVGVGLQDLVQEGSIGLSRAADKYDPSKGFKFSTYASWWIQQAVFRSIAYHSRTIRLPVHIHNMLNRVRKVRSNLQQGLGRPPTDEEMADAMDMRTSKYKRMLLLTRRSISLELPQYLQNPKDMGFEGEDTIADMATASAQNNDPGSDNVLPERTVDRSLFHEDLKGMLKKLTKDERTVIALRYGLADGLTRTVTSVAAELRQSPSAVRSHESKALRKLRRPWYEKKLDEHRLSLLG